MIVLEPAQPPSRAQTVLTFLRRKLWLAVVTQSGLEPGVRMEDGATESYSRTASVLCPGGLGVLVRFPKQTVALGEGAVTLFEI